MDLREPLLQQSIENEQMTPCSDWPTEAAERAKLYIPYDWPGSQDMDATCVVTYDATNNLICIKHTQGRVLDVIDPRDVIGADLEIKLFGPTDVLEHVGFRNAKARLVDHDDDKDDIVHTASSNECNIFKPLEQNVEKIFSLVDNAEIPFDTQATAILNIYAYPRKHPSQETWGNWFGLTEFKPMPNPNPPEPVKDMGNRYAHHRRFEVVPSEDFADIRSLVRALRSVSSLKEPPTRYLVFLNPMGGQKKAQMIYDTIVRPMLEQACVDHDLVATTRARHAEEYIMCTDFDLYDGFITMSGDGLIHEALQGIRRRSDAVAVLKKVKMGVIGCGTSNGLAKSILHESEELYSPLESTFLICKGRTSLLDLSEYTTKEKTYTSFLTYSYGMIADIDIDSEFLRCLGTLRLDLWGAYLGIKLHSYPVRLSYLSPLSNARRGNVEMPALSDPVPSNWTTIEDDIVLLWASQVSHASSHIQTSPPSHLHDGLFQIMIVRRGGLSRYNMIKWLLSLDHHGSHMNCDITEIIECVAWRLEPLTEGSYNNLDGEVVESGPIQGRVLPSGIRTFGDSVHQKQGENPLIDTLASF